MKIYPDQEFIEAQVYFSYFFFLQYIIKVPKYLFIDERTQNDIEAMNAFCLLHCFALSQGCLVKQCRVLEYVKN